MIKILTLLRTYLDLISIKYYLTILYIASIHFPGPPSSPTQPSFEAMHLEYVSR